jgi:hypothetical protein
MYRLAELLLKKPLGECTEQELHSIAEKYPFFSAGHLLTLKKSLSENSRGSNALIQKAALYFHPLQLQALLNNEGNAILTLKEINEPETAEAIPGPAVPEADTKELSALQNENEETCAGDQITIQSNHSVANHIQPAASSSQIPENSNQDQAESEKPIFLNELRDSPDTEQASDNQKQKTTIEPTLAFEPYHTVDYFASQGIRVKMEENPPDKFSKQLKSFTEWLKTLKKLPDAGTITPVKIPAEQKVEQLAETSLTDSNIETEAMAEVWAKQGNKEKAIEIYHKLSLLEPSKSPYFASLISALKNN